MLFGFFLVLLYFLITLPPIWRYNILICLVIVFWNLDSLSVYLPQTKLFKSGEIQVRDI